MRHFLPRIAPIRSLSTTPSSTSAAPAFRGGLRGFLERLRRGRVFRADLEPENWRQPWQESRFRYPSPGSQRSAAIPQGPQERIFDIRYFDRDARRRVIREAELVRITPGGLSGEAAQEHGAESLPPTPGQVPQWRLLGYGRDFGR